MCVYPSRVSPYMKPSPWHLLDEHLCTRTQIGWYNQILHPHHFDITPALSHFLAEIYIQRRFSVGATSIFLPEQLNISGYCLRKESERDGQRCRILPIHGRRIHWGCFVGMKKGDPMSECWSWLNVHNTRRTKYPVAQARIIRRLPSHA